MSLVEWCAVLGVVGVAIIILQHANMSHKLSLTVAALRSLDAELFHLSQEQNPKYGVCSSCGQRTIVRHVVVKGREPDDLDEPELFYCQPCWWLSDLVEAGDESRHYKDRLTKRDRLAARVGPGRP